MGYRIGYHNSRRREVVVVGAREAAAALPGKNGGSRKEMLVTLDWTEAGEVGAHRHVLGAWCCAEKPLAFCACCDQDIFKTSDPMLECDWDLFFE